MRQKAGGSNAIYVIIAENGNFFAPLQSQSHPLGSGSHAFHQVGITEGCVTTQIFMGLTFIFDAPGRQHHGGQGSISVLYQRIHRAHFRCAGFPDSIFHKQYTSIIIIFSIL